MHGEHGNLQIGHILKQLIIPLTLISLNTAHRKRHKQIKRIRAQPIHHQKDDNEDNRLYLDLSQLLPDFDLLDLLVEVGVLDLLLHVLVDAEGVVVLQRVDLFHAEFFLAHLLVFLV